MLSAVLSAVGGAERGLGIGVRGGGGAARLGGGRLVSRVPTAVRSVRRRAVRSVWLCAMLCKRIKRPLLMQRTPRQRRQRRRVGRL